MPRLLPDWTSNTRLQQSPQTGRLLENLGSEVKIIVNLDNVGGNRDAIMRLYAIIGWATYHEHECEHDGFERD